MLPVLGLVMRVISFPEIILWKIFLYIKQNWNNSFSSEVDGVSGVLFQFSFSTTQSISKLLPVKASSSFWVSDESDEFFWNRFLKKYLNISSRIGIVLLVLRLMAWVVCFSIFYLNRKIISKSLSVKSPSSSEVSDKSDEFFSIHFMKNISESINRI